MVGCQLKAWSCNKTRGAGIAVGAGHSDKTRGAGIAVGAGHSDKTRGAGIAVGAGHSGSWWVSTVTSWVVGWMSGVRVVLSVVAVRKMGSPDIDVVFIDLAVT